MTTFENSCKRIWQTILPAEKQEKIALLGIGSEFNGDDAAGVAFVRAVGDAFADSPHVLVLEGGLAPENFTGTLRRYQPARVVLVDAAEMSQPPGAPALLDADQIEAMHTTHTFPLNLLARYLQAEIGCRVFILGIQPAQTDPFTPLSAAVQKAVEKLAETLLGEIG